MLLKKILLSLLLSFLVFVFLPKNVFADCTNVASNTCPAGSSTSTQTTFCSVSKPPAGNVSRYCCDAPADCDALKSATNQQIAQKMATSTTTAPPWYSQDFKTWLGKVDDPNNPSEIFGERYTSAQVEWVIWGLVAFFIHRTTPPGVVATCINGDLTGCVNTIINALKGLAMNTTTNQNLAQLIFADRPLSGISYVRHTIQNFSLVPTAHAQVIGTGFTALSGVQNLWTAFRNIAFGLFVIATIVLSFMIMFRVKISPQVVISVQSAIPKIVIALILVTFSYAIAGLLVDLMYIVIGMLSVFLAPVIPSASLLTGHDSFSAPDLFNMLTIGPVSGHGANLSSGGIMGLLSLYLAPFILIVVVVLLIGGVILLAVTGPAAPIVAVIGLVLLLVLFVIMLWITIKIIWSLFKAFANVLLLTIFAPLYLTAGILIPNFGFGQWVKSFVSHLAVFVVTGVMWLLAWIFMLEAFVGTNNLTSLTNTASGTSADPWPPLLNWGGGGGRFLAFWGVSFVMFTLIPKAAELIQSFLSGKPFAYGTAIGEAFGGLGLLYGASGGKETFELARRAYREEQLRKAVASGETTQAGLLQQVLSRLENLPVVGQTVTNVKSSVESGLNKHH